MLVYIDTSCIYMLIYRYDTYVDIYRHVINVYIYIYMIYMLVCIDTL